MDKAPPGAPLGKEEVDEGLDNLASKEPGEKPVFGDQRSTKRPKVTQAEQIAEFERIAREHGAEGDEETFDRVLRKLARPRAT